MPKPKSGAEMVYWKDVEIAALCRRIAEEHIRLVRPINTKTVYELATMEGQEWRARKGPNVFPSTFKKFVEKYTPEINRLVEELRAAGMKNAAEQPRTQAESFLPQPVPETAPAPEPAEPAQVIAPPASLGQMIDKAVEQMVQNALATQAKEVMATLERMFSGIPGYTRPAIPRTASIIAEALKKNQAVAQVILVGALPEQINSVQAAFPNVDVRGYKDQMPAEENPDLVVAMTKFIDHPMEARIRKRYKDKVVRVHGAASLIKSTIQAKLHIHPLMNGVH